MSTDELEERVATLEAWLWGDNPKPPGSRPRKGVPSEPAFNIIGVAQSLTDQPVGSGHSHRVRPSYSLNIPGWPSGPVEYIIPDYPRCTNCDTAFKDEDDAVLIISRRPFLVHADCFNKLNGYRFSPAAMLMPSTLSGVSPGALA